MPAQHPPTCQFVPALPGEGDRHPGCPEHPHPAGTGCCDAPAAYTVTWCDMEGGAALPVCPAHADLLTVDLAADPDVSVWQARPLPRKVAHR